jgi:hypothetical protein
MTLALVSIMIDINNSSVNKYQKLIFIVNSLISNNLELSFAQKYHKQTLYPHRKRLALALFFYIYIYMCVC